MSNHYHITLKCNAEDLLYISKRLKAKPISIDLWKDTKRQTDRMLTKYHRNIEELYNKSKKDIEIITKMGFEVVRLKIEEVIDTFTLEDITKCVYLEGHIKVMSNTKLPNIDGFILSSNNEKTNTRFYNFRIRNEDDFYKVRRGMNILVDSSIISTEYEKVLFDSNIKHDRWWG